MNNNQLQQGDVLLRRVEALPEGKCVTIARRNCVVAVGEATGHVHRITDKAATLVKINGVRFLITSNDVTLLHDEHRPVMVPSGKWQIGIVREYDWLQKMERTVID